MKNLAFLASPYWHPDKSVRVKRHSEALEATKWLSENGWHCYSPIVYGLATHSEFEGRQTHTWALFCYRIIDACDYFLVLCTDGWMDSAGIADETKYAFAAHKPVMYVTKKGRGQYNVGTTPY